MAVFAYPFDSNRVQVVRASRQQDHRSIGVELLRKSDGTVDGCVTESIRKEIDLIQINLIDRSNVALLRSMDSIVCRNVIIYFDLETKKQVIGTFHDMLIPGGYLLLGHSESLINVTNQFELAQLTDDLVYRRPGLGNEIADPWQTLAKAAIDEVDEPRRKSR
mgnify:CR=1 FL=1